MLVALLPPAPAPSAATTRSRRFEREPLTSTRHVRRRALPRSAAIRASTSANQCAPAPKASTAWRAVVADREQARRRRARARLADLARAAAPTPSPSSRMSPSTSQRSARRGRQHAQAGAHRARVGVVGVVDQPRAAGERLDCEPAATGAHARQARRRSRRARRRRRAPPRPRPARSCTLCSPASAERDARARPAARPARTRSTKPSSVDALRTSRGA